VSILSLHYYFQLSSNYINITVEQAMELSDTNPSLVVLDVRTEEEFFSARIEEAKNTPVDDLVTRLMELNPNDEILVYSRTGNKNVQAAIILVQNGVLDFYHMDGELVAWKQARYPTVL